MEEASSEHPDDVRFYSDGVAEDVSDPTGISAALVKSDGVKSEVYNLNGQRVSKTGKGVYIVNGKKMVIK